MGFAKQSLGERGAFFVFQRQCVFFFFLLKEVDKGSDDTLFFKSP